MLTFNTILTEEEIARIHEVSLEVAAHEKVSAILKAYKAPVVDEDVLNELEKIAAAAEKAAAG